MPLGVIMSKKNIKNNKKNSTRKNYKIEALEPRLMMDADSDFNPETSCLATVYTNLESAVETEVLNKTDDVHSAAVFLKDSSDNDISEVSQILSKVKSEVRSNVETAFKSAKTDAKNYIDNYNEEHKDEENFTAITSIKTSKFLEYFGQKLGNSNPVTVTGSKVNVSYNYKDKLEVGELGFGIEYLNNFTCYCLSIKAEASA